jgi:hypothetical protein
MIIIAQVEGSGTPPLAKDPTTSQALLKMSSPPSACNSLWSPKMHEYCAYVVGPDGHILNRIDLFCANDDEAKECAVRLVSGENIELWQRDRRIAEFRRRH